MKKKKILYYNWCPFDVGQGGGVSVYVQNLLEYSNKNENYDTYFLSSGYCYNPFTEKTYIRELKTKLGKDYKTYEIVNSDVIGPLGNLRYSIDKYLYGTKAVEVAKEFINEHGHFDIINIQNIGGIGNLTYLKKGCSIDEVIAFDTGPGNVIIDYFMNKRQKKDCNCSLFILNILCVLHKPLSHKSSI